MAEVSDYSLRMSQSRRHQSTINSQQCLASEPEAPTDSPSRRPQKMRHPQRARTASRWNSNKSRKGISSPRRMKWNSPITGNRFASRKSKRRTLRRWGTTTTSRCRRLTPIGRRSSRRAKPYRHRLNCRRSCSTMLRWSGPTTCNWHTVSGRGLGGARNGRRSNRRIASEDAL